MSAVIGTRPGFKRTILMFNMRHGGANLTMSQRDMGGVQMYGLFWRGELLADWLSADDFLIVLDAFVRGFDLARPK